MISIQTNYASMVGEQNLATNNTFQTKTIEALTSGYRINSSGDDPAGLAVANQFRSNVTELTQGVINGNSGVSTLQIIDGGLSNISTMLDRMKTLATESASGTFTGNRSTLDQEFRA
jgi:flagellin